MDIPTVTKEQMRTIDEYAEKHFGVELLQLMENAGRNVASLARDMLGGAKGREILILAGKGHNGGDGLVAARFLQNWGAKPTVIIAGHPDELKQLTKEQNGILRSMFVNTLYPTNVMQFEPVFKHTDLIIDGLLGYNISSDPQGMYANLIQLANNSGKKILAIDLPSGLDPDTGRPYNPCIRAKATLCLTLPKKGCLEKNAKQFTGDIYVADLGVPNEVYQLMSLPVGPIFERKDIVKIS